MDSEISRARIEFGILVKNARLRLEPKQDRGVFAREIGVKPIVVRRLEHGEENPTREELERAVNALNLSKKERDTAYNLLRIFSPLKRRKRIKFHLFFSARVRRHPKSY
jgi:hypothetical protein